MKIKSLFKKFFSLILLVPVFFISGCVFNVEIPEVDPDLPLGVDFDGMTHTYDEYPFLGAYVFVDPGANGEIIDGFSSSTNEVEFYKLVNRQYTILAEELSYRLLSVYGSQSQTVDANKEFKFGETDFKISVAKHNIIDNDASEKYPNPITESDMFALGVDTVVEEGSYLGFSSTDQTKAILQNYTYITGFGTCEYAGTNNVVKEMVDNGTILRTFNAINGGEKFELYENSYKFSGNLVTDTNAKWLINNAETFTQNIKLVLLNAVAGIQNNTNETTALNAIDHLGFTKKDKENVLKAIYENVIGVNALNYDRDSKTALQNIMQYTLDQFQKFNDRGQALNILSDNNIVNKKANLDVNYIYWTSEIDQEGEYKTFENAIAIDNNDNAVDEQVQWQRAHEYKGYEILIPSIVESAIESGEKATTDTTPTEFTDIYATFPRAQVLFMDIYTLQGTSKEEVENSQNNDIEYDESQDYQKLEKYLPDMNIISIVLLPNNVTGHPNNLVNGELVADETISIDGFLLGSIDFAISGEAGYNSTIYADYEIIAKGTKIKNTTGENFKSDSVEIYGNRIPEDDQEQAFNVYTDLLPLDEIREGTKSKEDFLIGEYNGPKIEDYQFNYAEYTTLSGGSYKLYTLKSGVDFIDYGDNGVEFIGGDNYVKINFIFTEIFNESDVNKTNNIVGSKVNTLLNLLSFNPEAC